MSALSIAPAGDTYSGIELSELDATYEISRIASKAENPARGIEMLARAVLRVKGVRTVQIRHETWGNAGLGFNASAIEGDIRIFFDPYLVELESPVRFTKFLSQQAGHLLRVFDLLRERSKLISTRSSLRHLIEKRKWIQRARAIVREQNDLDDKAALRLLVAHSRSSGTSLAVIAQAFVISQATSYRRPQRAIRPMRVAGTRLLEGRYGFGK